MWFKIGYCYLKSPFDNEKAIPYLERATTKISVDYQEGDHKEIKAPAEAMRYLANAYHRNYEFDAAIEAYEHFKTLIVENETVALSDIDRQIEICRNAIELLKTPINMTVTNAGKAVNSPYADYAPVISADESMLIFTSRRKGSTGKKFTEDGKFYEDIYICEKQQDGLWSKPKNMGGTINTSDHEATIGLAADGQTLLIYKYDNSEGFGDIFVSKLIGERWTLPERLGSNVNTKAWEPHASISANGQMLFFTSNREGGYGGTDIYFARILPTGEWALAQNCGPVINTPYNEDAPYFHPDGKTLYFSSKGHSTMGGYDIFFSDLQEDGTWSKSENIGYPVSTTGDDVFFVPTADGKRAYYSSFKKDGFGDLDIYMIALPEQKEKKLTVYKGYVKDPFGNVPEDVLIDVYNNETGELTGKYKPNSVTGKYLFIFSEGGNYNITYKAKDHLFHSENLVVPEDMAYSEVNQAHEIKQVIAGATTILKNIFFDYAKATLRDESKAELANLYELLNENPKLMAEISGHTDAKGDPDFNMKLSQHRTQSVADYLVKQGINAKRLTAKGYGETQPIAPNVKPDGSDNPEGRTINRRIELKVVALN